ncbi:hypothetical protein BH20ACT15_BH20ACT15_03180 [soil metagenome]
MEASLLFLLFGDRVQTPRSAAMSPGMAKVAGAAKALNRLGGLFEAKLPCRRGSVVPADLAACLVGAAAWRLSEQGVLRIQREKPRARDDLAGNLTFPQIDLLERPKGAEGIESLVIDSLTRFDKGDEGPGHPVAMVAAGVAKLKQNEWADGVIAVARERALEEGLYSEGGRGARKVGGVKVAGDCARIGELEGDSSGSTRNGVCTAGVNATPP